MKYLVTDLIILVTLVFIVKTTDADSYPTWLGVLILGGIMLSLLALPVIAIAMIWFGYLTK